MSFEVVFNNNGKAHNIMNIDRLKSRFFIFELTNGYANDTFITNT